MVTQRSMHSCYEVVKKPEADSCNCVATTKTVFNVKFTSEAVCTKPDEEDGSLGVQDNESH